MSKKNKKNRITVKDFILAVKIADREIELENQTGWSAKNKVHKNLKKYKREKYRKYDLFDE